MLPVRIVSTMLLAAASCGSATTAATPPTYADSSPSAASASASASQASPASAAPSATHAEAPESRCTPEGLASLTEETAKMLTELPATPELLGTPEDLNIRGASERVPIEIDSTAENYLLVCSTDPVTLTAGRGQIASPPWLKKIEAGHRGGCLKAALAFGPKAEGGSYEASGCVRQINLRHPIPALVQAERAREEADARRDEMGRARSSCGDAMTQQCMGKGCWVSISYPSQGGLAPRPNDPSPKPICSCDCNAGSHAKPNPSRDKMPERPSTAR